MPIIDSQQVFKTYNQGKNNEYHALKNISFTIEKGEFISIIGASGAGKSTLINIIAGFENPTKGKLIVNNCTISELNENRRAIFRRKEIGFIFQSFCLIPELSVIENVMLPLLINGYGFKQSTNMAKDTLKLVNLENKYNHRTDEISGGEKQRVAIARAIITKPSIIIADEPTGNLDSENGNTVLNILNSLNKEYGHTIVMVTHSNDATRFSNKIITIKDGVIQGG